MVKIRLRGGRLSESAEDEGRELVMDDALSRMTQAAPGQEPESPADEDPAEPAGAEAPAEPKPYITPGLKRAIRHGKIEDLLARMQARADGTLADDKPADAADGMTEYQRIMKIRQEGKEAEYFHAEERDSAVEEMLTIFKPGNNVRNTVSHVEKTLRKNLVTVAVRFKGSAARGTQTCWSTQNAFGAQALRELDEYRKSKTGQMSISVIWFTDLVDGSFIQDFFTGSAASSFKNSGVMLRLSHFSEKMLSCLPELKYFTTLIFGERFEFDLAWTKKPKLELMDASEEAKGKEKSYIRDLGLLNFNLIDVLDNIPGLCRLIVDKGHPDFYNDARYNLIRKTPIRFKSLGDVKKRLNKQDHKYVYDQLYLLQQLNDQEEVLWYAPSTWASDNTGAVVYGRDGKERTVSGPGRDPGVFRVPEGITALNPFCFGQRNYGIRKLRLPASLEVPPMFAYSFLPNLEEITYAGAAPDKIPVGTYMGYEPKNRGKRLGVPGSPDVIEDLAFANTGAREIVFEDPSQIYYIGRGAFGSGMVNPFGGPGSQSIGGANASWQRSHLWNHSGSARKDYLGSVFSRDIIDAGPSDAFNVLPSGTYGMMYSPTKKGWTGNPYATGSDAVAFDKGAVDARAMLNGAPKYTNALSGGCMVIIGEDAFAGCQNMSFSQDGELAIPDTIRKIGACAFADALYNTETLTLPASLSKDDVGACAFYISRYLVLKYRDHLLAKRIPGAMGNPLSGTGSSDYEKASWEMRAEFQKISKLRTINLPGDFKDGSAFFAVFGMTPECAQSIGISVNFI